MRIFSRNLLKMVGTIPENSENKIGTIPKISEEGSEKCWLYKITFFISPIKSKNTRR